MEIFKDLYEAEIARRQELNEEITLPDGVLTLLGGMLALMLREYSWSGGAFQWVFIVSVALAAIGLLISVGFLVRSYWGFDAQYVAKPDDLYQHVEELREHFRQFSNEEQSPEEAAVTHFEKALERLFAEAGAYNAQQNDRRSELLHRAKGAMILVPKLARSA